MLKNFFLHLNMVRKHRAKVLGLCAKCGLFWRGFLHDFSKFSPIEFFEGVKYYNGKYSPIIDCRREKGYSLAAIHHINNNKHHFDYWIDIENKEQIDMPYKYAVECVCDKISATMCYNGKSYNHNMPYEYWMNHKDSYMTNDRMKNFIETVLFDLSQFGLNYVLNKKYLKQKYQELVIDANNKNSVNSENS